MNKKKKEKKWVCYLEETIASPTAFPLYSLFNISSTKRVSPKTPPIFFLKLLHVCDHYQITTNRQDRPLAIRMLPMTLSTCSACSTCLLMTSRHRIANHHLPIHFYRENTNTRKKMDVIAKRKKIKEIEWR